MFDNDQLYSIGQAAEICDVSRRTLRFYEIKGLISPDHLSEGGYRYYTMETLRRVQVIRYFLEEGFSLDQAGKLLNTNDLDDYEEVFRDQIQKTLAEIDFYRNRLESLKGWYGLLCEGKRVRLLGQDNFTLKHIPTRNYMFLEDYLDVDDPYAQANLETKHYTMAKQNGHAMIDVGGSYILYNRDLLSRVDMRTTAVTLLQEYYPAPSQTESKNIRKIPGFLAVSAYHIGELLRIPETYRRAVKWAESHQLPLRGDCYERYVIDIYTSDDPTEYITEILLPLDADPDPFNYLEEQAKNDH